MIQVRPGQRLPLSYVVAAGTAGLVIKASIQTLLGAELQAVTLAEVAPGVHSDQSFAMPTGRDFLRVAYKPFLSGGVTPDTTNPISMDLFEVVTPIFADGLRAFIGVDDQPNQQPITVAKTSDENLLLAFKDRFGQPVDTSAATSVAFRMKKDDLTTLTKSLGSGITAVSGAVGQYLVQLLAADLATLRDGENDVQVEVVLPDGKHVVQLREVLSVEASIVA